jgi:TRAP-type C4-dicarboxylate transport system permease small subunit
VNALRSAMIWTGGAALIAATAVDTVAVVGRQVGFAIHGSIELMQAAVLLAGSVALVAATAAGNHARVRLVVERMGDWRSWFETASDLLTAVFLAMLLTGSTWLAVDLWHSHEIGEITGLPWRWLRLFVNVALAAMIAIGLIGLFKGKKR